MQIDYSGVNMIDGKPHIWLQSYGLAPAKQAKELKPGDIRLYNFGSTGEILSVRQGKKTVYIEIQEENGQIYNVKYRSERYIPMVN